MSTKSMNPQVKKVLVIVANVLVWLFVAFSVLVTVLAFKAQSSADGIPSLFGKSLITVKSDSMSPTFREGDLIFIQKSEKFNIHEMQVGDIITYNAPIDINGDGKTGDLNTHRIVSITYAEDGKSILSLKTKGDNTETNPTEDNYDVSIAFVVGRYTGTRLAGVGNAIDFLRSPTGFLIFIVLPLLVFFLFELYRFISLIVKEKMKNAAEAAASAASAAASAPAAPVVDEEEIKRRAVEEYLRAQAEKEKSAPAAEAQTPADTPADTENKKNEDDTPKA